VLAETAEVLADCPPLSEAAEARMAEAHAVAAAARRPALDAAALAALRDSHLAAAA
jgi:hypothetical protein